jgi:hypothetical protein
MFFFLKFFDGIMGFLILTWDLEKKRRKVVVHHTHRRQHRRGSCFCAAALWTFSYGVKRPPLSWLCFLLNKIDNSAFVS